TSLTNNKNFTTPIHWIRNIGETVEISEYTFAYAGDTLYMGKFDTMAVYTPINKAYIKYDSSTMGSLFLTDIDSRIWGIGEYVTENSGKSFFKSPHFFARPGLFHAFQYESNLKYQLQVDNTRFYRSGVSTRQGLVYTTLNANQTPLGKMYHQNDNWGKPLNYANVTALARTYKTVYAVTESGTIFTTGNEGNTWKKCDIEELDSTDDEITALGSYNDYVFIGTKYGYVLRSSDGGASWSTPMFTTDSISNNIQKPIFSFYTKDDTLFLSTSQGLYFSTHYGVDWNRVTTTMLGTRYWAQKGKTLFACSPYSKSGDVVLDKGLYSSSDVGITWRKVTMPDVDSVLCMNATSEYIMLGTTNGLYISSNDGQSWQQRRDLFPQKDSIIKDITSYGTNVILIAGENVYHLHSSLKQGVTNLRNGMPRRVRLSKLLIDFNTVYLGTANNSVYKSKNIPLEIESELPTDSYTNNIQHAHVASGVLYIHYTSPIPVHTTIELINILGNEVVTTITQDEAYTSMVDVNNLPTGTYIIKVTTPTRKMSVPILIVR
ncbi:MAG: T9SS type A sorting domain-containing protein, partial [Candidatus Kapabacteria bacterium]|nr:T9SS type A sorting domain-containing protein [Candidatus Kapabacteria bacterium]